MQSMTGINRVPWITLAIIALELFMAFMVRQNQADDESYAALLDREWQLERIRLGEYFKAEAEPDNVMKKYSEVMKGDPRELTNRFLVFTLALRTRNTLDTFWQSHFTTVFQPQGGPPYLEWQRLIFEQQQIRQDSRLLRHLFIPSRRFELTTFLQYPLTPIGYGVLFWTLFFFYVASSSLERAFGHGRFLLAVILTSQFVSALAGLLGGPDYLYLAGLNGTVYGLFGLTFNHYRRLNLRVSEISLPALGVIPVWIIGEIFWRGIEFPLHTPLLPWSFSLSMLFFGLISWAFEREGGYVSRRWLNGNQTPSTLTMAPRPSEHPEVRRARFMIAKGDGEKAIIKLKGVLGLDPENIEAHQLLFEAHIEFSSKIEARQEAIRLFNKYLIMDQKKEALHVYDLFNQRYRDDRLTIPPELYSE
jgi:membrane associated rhomboid family serine protease